MTALEKRVVPKSSLHSVRGSSDFCAEPQFAQKLADFPDLCGKPLEFERLAVRVETEPRQECQREDRRIASTPNNRASQNPRHEIPDASRVKGYHRCTPMFSIHSEEFSTCGADRQSGDGLAVISPFKINPRLFRDG